jgi:hypothetical protein
VITSGLKVYKGFLENSKLGESKMPKKKEKVEAQPETQPPFEIQTTSWEEFEKFETRKKSKYKEYAEFIVNEILRSETPLIFKIPERGLILAVIREINKYNATSQSAKIVYKVSYKEKAIVAGVKRL